MLENKVIPLRERPRNRKLITPSEILSAAVYYSYDILNSIAYFKFNNFELYRHFEKTLTENLEYGMKIKRGFDEILMDEINYILDKESCLLIPQKSQNGIIYKSRKNIGMFYDSLFVLTKAVALELGIEFFMEFGCDKHGILGENTPISICI
ncbi:MAG: hypothetical protein QXW97_01615 [Candidatus Pacearchaeota archaeon]